MNINEILKGTENTTVEFKEEINESIFKIISAFAIKMEELSLSVYQTKKR